MFSQGQILSMNTNNSCKPGQEKSLALQKSFQLNGLPFFSVDMSGDSNGGLAKFNEAAKVSTDMIWEASGLRFAKTYSQWYGPGKTVSLYFNCCQDKKKIRQSEAHTQARPPSHAPISLQKQSQNHSLA